MKQNEDFLSSRLAERTEQQVPSSKAPADIIDFCSNDYVGIIRNRLLRNRPTGLHTGSGGTRIQSGDFKLLEQTEERIAAFHDAEAAVIFSSGYDANLGFLASVPQQGDTILFDEGCHPSVKDGVRLSSAHSVSFEHNETDDLQVKLAAASGNIFVFTEAVFDADGSIAPLEHIALLCRQHKANLVVNESHSIGLFGEKGEGLVYELGLEEQVFARIHGFGNACGCHGAVILGSSLLKQYLLHFCHQLMYSTALSEQTVATIWESYKILPQLWQERAHLNTIVQTFHDADLPFEKLDSRTPIQHLLVPGVAQVMDVADKIRQAGFDVRPVCYPLVPKGSERLRIVLHSYNTRGEVSWLIQAIHAITPVIALQTENATSATTESSAA